MKPILVLIVLWSVPAGLFPQYIVLAYLGLTLSTWLLVKGDEPV